MARVIGKAEAERRAMRERWYAEGQAKNKATVAELRETVAAVKLKPRKAKKKKGKS